MLVASSVRRNFPTGNDVSFVAAFLTVKTTPSGRSRTRAPSRRRSSMGLASIRWTRSSVERHTQRFLIPQDLSRLRTRRGSRLSGRSWPLLARRAVTFVRTSGGVSNPRRNGPGAASPGWQRGALTPPVRSPPSSARPLRRHRTPPHSRDCESASSRTPAGCGFTVVREAPPSASPIRGPVQRLEGGQLRSETLSPLFVAVPTRERCAKLTLTLTTTRGRAR